MYLEAKWDNTIDHETREIRGALLISNRHPKFNRKLEYIPAAFTKNGDLFGGRPRQLYD